MATTFSGINWGETDEQETARLAQSPEGSQYHTLSLLPVCNSMVETHRLYELAGMRGDSSAGQRCSGTTGGLAHECDGTHRVVVIPIERRPGPTAGGPLASRLRDDSWHCRVVSSDHPSYSAGGHDLAISESELRRSPVVEI